MLFLDVCFAPLYPKRCKSFCAVVGSLCVLAAMFRPPSANAQGTPGTVVVSNLDKSRYQQGEMSAKFFAVDAQGNPITNIQASEIIIRENGIIREIIPPLTDCSAGSIQPQNSLVSAVLSFDVSGSMFRQPLPRTSQERSLDFANRAAEQIVASLRPRMDAGGVDMAVQWCDDIAVLMQNFTFSAGQIVRSFPAPPPPGAPDCGNFRPCPNGNNDFTEHLLNPITGLINIARRGKGSSKVAVLLTDAIWTPLSRSEISECINICRINNIRFYAVLFGPRIKPSPIFPYAGIADSFRMIADSTGGAIYENILTPNDVSTITTNIINAIQALSQQASPCTIRWRTSSCQEEVRTVTMEIRRNNVLIANVSPYQNTQYLADANARTTPAISAQSLYFKVTQTSTTYRDTIFVTMPPVPQPYQLAISLDKNTNIFDVQPRVLQFTNNIRTLPLVISYRADDTLYNTAVLRLAAASGGCDIQIFLTAGLPGRGSTETLKLTRPNGGEKFLVFSKENVLWEGISSADVVRLEYTTDSGRTWNSSSEVWDTTRVAGVTKATLTESTSGLQWSWNTVPNTPSDKCLMRVSEMSSKPLRRDTVMPRGRLLPPNGFNCAGMAFVSSRTIPAAEGVVMIPTFPGTIQLAFPDPLPEAQRRTNVAGFFRAADAFGSSIVGVDNSMIPPRVSLGSIDATNLTQNLSTGITRTANAIAFYADNTTTDPNEFFIGFDDGVTRHYRFTGATIQLVASYGTPVASTDSSITVVRYARNRQRIVTGSVAGVIKVWSVGNTARPLYTFAPDVNTRGRVPINTLDVDASGDVIASGGNDGKVKLWVVGLPSALVLGNSSQHHIVPPPNQPVVTSVRFDRNSTYIMSTATDGFLKLWDVKTGTMLYSNDNRINSEITAGAFSQRSTQGEFGEIVIATVRSDGLVEIWRPQIPPRPLQQDVSDAQWSIVRPDITSQDVEMGEAYINTTKEKLTAFITNPSSVDTVVDSLAITGADASAFQYLSGIPLLISSGGTTQVEFRFRPTQARAYSADLIVREAFGKTQVRTSAGINAKIRGVGIQSLISQLIGNVTIPATPRCIDFGKVAINEVNPQNTDVIRVTGTDVRLESRTNLGPDTLQFVVGGTQATGQQMLGQGTVISLFVNFAPTRVGVASGGVRYVFVNAAGERQEVIIRLCGEGIGTPGRIAVNDVPTATRLTIPACATSATLFTTIASIGNVGGEAISVSARLVPPRPDMRLDLVPSDLAQAGIFPPNPSPTAIINPGSLPRYLRVTFTPAAAVPETTVNVQISTNASPNAPADRIIPLTIRNDVAAFTLNAQTLNFGTVTPGSTITQPIRISNTGSVPLTWAFPVSFDAPSLGTLRLQSAVAAAQPVTVQPSGSADITAVYTAPNMANQTAQAVSIAFPQPQGITCAAPLALTYQAGTGRAIEPAIAVFSSSALSVAGSLVCGPLQWSPMSMTITNTSRDNILFLRLRLRDGVFFEPPSPAFPALPVSTASMPSTLSVRITFRPPNSNAATARPVYHDTLFVETLSGDPRLSTTVVTKRDTIPLKGLHQTSLSQFVPSRLIVQDLGTYRYGQPIPTFADVFYLENLGTEPIPLPPSPYTSGPFEVTYRKGQNADSAKTFFSLRYTGTTAHGMMQPLVVTSPVVTFNDACLQAQTKGVTLTIGPKPPDPTAVLAVASAQGRVGDTVQVPVYLRSRTNFRPEDTLVTATLRFNASVLYLLDPAMRGRSTVDALTGLRSVALSMSVVSSDESVPIARVPVSAMFGNAAQAALIVDGAQMSGLSIPLAGANPAPTFTVLGLSYAYGPPLLNPAGAQVLKFVALKPVPVSRGEAVTLEYKAESDADVQVSVSDVLGNEYSTLALVLDPPKQAKQGRNTVTIPTTDLRPGVYFVNVYANVMTLTRRILVVQ
jgi:WD40 repeat protein